MSDGSKATFARLFEGRRLELSAAWGGHEGSCPAYIDDLVWSEDGARLIGIEAGSGGESRWDLWTGERIAGPAASEDARCRAVRTPRRPSNAWPSPDGRLLVLRAFAPIVINSSADPFANVRAAGPPLFAMVERSSGRYLWSASPAEPYWFSSDCALLTGMSLGDDDHAVVWRSATGEVVATCPVDDRPEALAVRSDGAVLLSFGERGRVTLWDLARGAPIWSRTVPHQSAFDAAPNGYDRVFRCVDARFSPGGELVIVHCNELRGVTARAFSTADGSPAWELTLPRVPSRDRSGVSERMAISPDGSRIAITDRSEWSWSTRVHVFQASTGREEAPKRGHLAGVTVVACSRDSRLVASGDQAGVVLVHVRGAADPALALRGPSSRVVGVAFSPEDGVLHVAWADGTIRRVDVATGAAIDAWIEEEQDAHGRVVPATIEAMALSEDGALALVVTDRGASLWDVPRGARRFHVRRPPWFEPYGRRHAVFSRGRALVSFSDGLGEIRTADGAPITLLGERRRDGGEDPYLITIRAMTATADGVCIAGEPSHHELGSVCLWKVCGGVLGRPRGIAAPPGARAVFSADGAALLTYSMQAFDSSAHASVSLWNVASGERVETVSFAEAGDVPTAVAFGGDGRDIVIGTARGVVMLARARDG